MSNRLAFHEILIDVLGSNNVYFQPPATVKMRYPCIVYSLSKMDLKKANNALYKNVNGYLVTVIDPNPDSEIPEKLLKLPTCQFDRHYTTDNLNHYSFIIYY